MNKIYIVHCWNGTKDDCWYPWLDKKISNNNNQVFRFNMPNTTTPKINEWVNELEKNIDTLDNNTFLVGHSIGSQAILRYLEKHDKDKIGGILLVAPWLELLPEAIEDEESYSIAKPWLDTKINFEKIKKTTNNITCIFSDDDYFVPYSQKDKFKKLLNSKIITVKNKGHIGIEDNINELDEIYNAMLDIIENKE